MRARAHWVSESEPPSSVMRLRVDILLGESHMRRRAPALSKKEVEYQEK